MLEGSRINLALSPSELEEIDSYWHAVQLESRQDAIYHLVALGLAGKAPPNREKISGLMEALAEMKRAESPTVPASDNRTEKVHLSFSGDELLNIDAFRLAARIVCRSTAIRQLAFSALRDDFSEDHLSIASKKQRRVLRALKI